MASGDAQAKPAEPSGKPACAWESFCRNGASQRGPRLSAPTIGWSFRHESWLDGLNIAPIVSPQRMARAPNSLARRAAT